jgi:hypothetical protein
MDIYTTSVQHYRLTFVQRYAMATTDLLTTSGQRYIITLKQRSL